MGLSKALMAQQGSPPTAPAGGAEGAGGVATAGAPVEAGGAAGQAQGQGIDLSFDGI